MHFKRKKPKEHIFGSRYWDDMFYSSGNHRTRATVHDQKQPQYYTEHSRRDFWRYKDAPCRDS